MALLFYLLYGNTGFVFCEINNKYVDKFTEYYILTTCTELNLLFLSACVYSVGSSLQAGLIHLVRFCILVVGRGKFNYDIHKVRPEVNSLV